MSKFVEKMIDSAGDILGTSKYQKTIRYIETFIKDHNISRPVYNQNKQEILDSVTDMKAWSFRYKYAEFIDEDNDGTYESEMLSKAMRLQQDLKEKFVLK